MGFTLRIKGFVLIVHKKKVKPSLFLILSVGFDFL